MFAPNSCLYQLGQRIGMESSRQPSGDGLEVRPPNAGRIQELKTEEMHPGTDLNPPPSPE